MWKTWFDYNRSATKVCSKHPFRFSNRTTKVEVTGRRSSLRVTLQIVNQNFTIRFVADPGSISKRWVASWPLSAHSHIQQVDIHCHLDNTNQIFQTVRSYKCSILSRLIFQFLHVVCCGDTTRQLNKSSCTRYFENIARWCVIATNTDRGMKEILDDWNSKARGAFFSLQKSTCRTLGEKNACMPRVLQGNHFQQVFPAEAHNKFGTLN